MKDAKGGANMGAGAAQSSPSFGPEARSDAEARFFQRLRTKLAPLTPDRRTAHPGRRPDAATDARRLKGEPGRACVPRFVAEWQRVGGECVAVADRGQIGAAVRRLVEDAGAMNVLRTADARWDGTDVDAQLAEAGIHVLRWGGPNGASRGEAAAAGVGLTWVEAASAETGTLLERATEANGRLASLLPPVHVAVVDVERIFPHRSALFRWLGETGLPFRGMALITGPSRTGDIQNDLTVGVHGPKRAIAVLVGVDALDSLSPEGGGG